MTVRVFKVSLVVGLVGFLGWTEEWSLLRTQ